SGPSVLSLPAWPSLAEVAGYLDEFLRNDGWIAWGVIPTDKPVPMTIERPWRELRTLWCRLVTAGCDPNLLLRQSLLTPACGLFSHAEGVAGRVFRLLRGLSEKVREESTALALAVGR